MKATNNYENQELKVNEKEKKNIMYSQLFNYNTMSKDGMLRSADVSAAVEAGGKDISDRKSRLIALAILGGFTAFVLLMITATSFMGASTGVYLESKDGASILVRDSFPVVMSNRTEKDFFGTLNDGDKIFVIHDGINESYPGSTGVYVVFKLSDGTTRDIPQQILNQLIELGWIENVTEE